MRARIWIPAKGEIAIRWFPKIGLLKTSSHFGIPEGPVPAPELEGILNSASLQLLEASRKLVPKQV